MQGKAIVTIEKRGVDLYATMRTSELESVEEAFLVDEHQRRPYPTTGDFELITEICAHVWVKPVLAISSDDKSKKFAIVEISTMGWTFSSYVELNFPETPQQSFLNQLEREYGAKVFLSSMGALITYHYYPSNLYAKNLPIKIHSEPILVQGDSKPGTWVPFQINEEPIPDTDASFLDDLPEGVYAVNLTNLSDKLTNIIKAHMQISDQTGYFFRETPADGPETEHLGDDEPMVEPYAEPPDEPLFDMDGGYFHTPDPDKRDTGEFGPVPFGDGYEAPFSDKSMDPDDPNFWQWDRNNFSR